MVNSRASGVMSQTVELTNTPITPDSETNVQNLRQYAFFTLPSTKSLYKITAIEWKNGTVADGNVICGVDIVDADPPVSTTTTCVAYGTPVTQTGTTAVQRNNFITSQFIPKGTVLGAWFNADSATNDFEFDALGSQNQRQTSTYSTLTPATHVVAWTATTTRCYIKVYYRGYS